MKRFTVSQEICSGCRACEVACVARHENRFGTSAARIRVTKDEPLGIDRPHVCWFCGRPPCVAACPTGALYQEEERGVIRLHPEKCDSCAACLAGCPFGMIRLHPETNLPIICDLCDGDPACVKRCATGAIVYE